MSKRLESGVNSPTLRTLLAVDDTVHALAYPQQGEYGLSPGKLLGGMSRLITMQHYISIT